MYKGSNCDRKSQLSEILTEPLNTRAVTARILSSFFINHFHTLPERSFNL